MSVPARFDMDTIAVWFSCGAASAVAAKKTLELYGKTHTVRIVNNPIREEDSDNRRFLHDIESWLDVEIELATHPKFPDQSVVDVWNYHSFMSGPTGAPCTRELKKFARQLWEKENAVDFRQGQHVLGFTVDEKKRYERFIFTERANTLPILIDANLTKQDCANIIMRAGIKLPRVYEMGYPNANCIGCVKATSPTYWNLVRQTHPLVFKSRARQSRRIGAKLVRVNNERIYLDELDPKAQGRPLKKMVIDCGIFCEEPDRE